MCMDIGRAAGCPYNSLRAAWSVVSRTENDEEGLARFCNLCLRVYETEVALLQVLEDCGREIAVALADAAEEENFAVVDFIG